MNVFSAAMGLIQSINPCQTVIIRSRKSIFDANTGIYNEKIEEIEASAQVQTTPSSVQDMSDTATNSYNVYDLWFINLTPVIVDALVSTDVLNTDIVLNNGIVLRIIEKEDYTYNGWIYCKGVQHANT